MKKYKYIEYVIKSYFSDVEFTLTDVRLFIKYEKRKEIEATYFSKLFKQLTKKEILKLIRIDKSTNPIFPKKYYKLNDNKEWEKIFI